MKKCPVCVKDIPDDAQYCAYCGYDVSTGIAPVRKKCEDRSGRYIGGMVLIVLGVIFLISAYTPYDFGELWPLILIALGVATLLKRS
jgi:fatty acid desaturase